MSGRAIAGTLAAGEACAGCASMNADKSAAPAPAKDRLSSKAPLAVLSPTHRSSCRSVFSR